MSVAPHSETFWFYRLVKYINIFSSNTKQMPDIIYVPHSLICIYQKLIPLIVCTLFFLAILPLSMQKYFHSFINFVSITVTAKFLMRRSPIQRGQISSIFCKTQSNRILSQPNDLSDSSEAPEFLIYTNNMTDISKIKGMCLL